MAAADSAGAVLAKRVAACVTDIADDIGLVHGRLKDFRELQHSFVRDVLVLHKGDGWSKYLTTYDAEGRLLADLNAHIDARDHLPRQGSNSERQA